MTVSRATVDPIRIEDLCNPQQTEFQRAAIEYAKSRQLVFDRDQLMTAAVQRTGCSDFGADDFVARLDAMIAAVELDVGLNELGRMNVHDRLTRLLCQRLLFTDLLLRHPEIMDIELEPPVIVVGLPRSGTTHLVNLIASDTRFRALPSWESLEPIPSPGRGPGIDGVDRRYLRSMGSYEAQVAMVPLLRVMHDGHPQLIEEEIALQDLDFSSYTLEWLARVPTWRDHYLALDQRPHYSYVRKVLQALTWLRGPRRWVLKSPQHLEQIGPLVQIFPDATFAVTHRDPVSVIQSAITMLAYGDRVRRHSIEPDILSTYWINRVEQLMRAFVRDSHLLPHDRLLDINFNTFMADDLATVGEIYDRAGLAFTDRARGELAAFMADHPRGKFGQVSYDLQGDFGLEPDVVRKRFEFYFDRFPVDIER